MPACKFNGISESVSNKLHVRVWILSIKINNGRVNVCNKFLRNKRDFLHRRLRKCFARARSWLKVSCRRWRKSCQDFWKSIVRLIPLTGYFWIEHTDDTAYQWVSMFQCYLWSNCKNDLLLMLPDTGRNTFKNEHWNS